MTISSVSNTEVLNDYISSQNAAKAAVEETQSEAKKALFGNYDTFLKILVAQLQNQDPTEPMDPGQFTQQLVQYSAVEQQMSTNEKLDTLLSTLNPNGITPLLSYVGQYVETATTNKMVVQGGVGMLSYNLPSESQSVVLSVQDAQGNVVAKVDGTTKAGINRVAWDGSLDAGGVAPDGIYRFVLTARSSLGEDLSVEDVRAIGMVTSIETDAQGAVTLKVSDLSVKDKDVLSVFAGIGVSGQPNTEAAAAAANNNTQTDSQQSESEDDPAQG